MNNEEALKNPYYNPKGHFSARGWATYEDAFLDWITGYPVPFPHYKRRNKKVF